MAAQEFAKALNCVRQDGDACDVCLPCRKIAAGNHPDVSYIAPVKKSRIIDVDTVEGIINLASLRPFESKWRVFVILEADRMDDRNGQNKFLKTLEEPPGNSLFILVTEHPSQLLPTMRSRCQRVRFGPLRTETVLELLLRDRDLPPDVAQSVAALAQGQMSRALDLVDSNRREIALDITRRLEEGGDPVALAEEFSKLLDSRRAQIKTAIEAEVDTAETADLSREDREEQKKQQLAVAEAIIRRDIIEYLYLFETWYRDKEVVRVTHDPARVLNRDSIERLQKGKPSDLGAKRAAFEKAHRYLERFLNEERVFRDLFFALAD
jgi:DNA polymerase-3 subunit delta'